MLIKSHRSSHFKKAILGLTILGRDEAGTLRGTLFNMDDRW